MRPTEDETVPAIAVQQRLEALLGSGGVDVLDAIYDGILIADAENIVLYVNPEYTRITGVLAEAIVGRRLGTVRSGATLPEVIRSGRRRAGVYRREGDTEYIVDMAPICVQGRIMGGISVLKDLTEVQALSTELARLNRLRRSLGHLHAARYTFADIVGNSPITADVLNRAERMAATDADILILGESGTGKEVFAQSIHNASPRARKPFLALNCATLAPDIIESELFGYTEGAFTGAKRGGKEGFFEVADGGTLFLDEISELSLAGQAKLLRVLQERMVRRVGDTGETPLDLRVIVASNRDLVQQTERGLFRSDLYYRLNVLQLELPPLRRRVGDIALLASFFAGTLARGETVPVFSPCALTALESYTWPGNIRELRNAVEYALHLCAGGVVERVHLPQHVLTSSAHPDVTAGALSAGEDRRSLEQVVAEAETRAIAAMLRRHGTDLSAKRQIAADLGISLSTLYAKIERYHLGRR